MQAAADEWRHGRTGFTAGTGRSAAARARVRAARGRRRRRRRDRPRRSRRSPGWSAAALPDGARVLAAEGDFTSVLFPFLAQARRGVTRRARAARAARRGARAAPRPRRVQRGAERGRARRRPRRGRRGGRRARRAHVRRHDAGDRLAPLDHGALRLHRVRGLQVAAQPARDRVLHAAPGAARRAASPHGAGWYAGEDVDASYYGAPLRLAADARRFDLSPAWHCWVGAAPALELLAERRDRGDRTRTTSRSRTGCARGSGMPPGDSAIVSVGGLPADAAARLAAAGVMAAGRGGALRLSFHLYTTEADVDRALAVAAQPVEDVRPVALVVGVAARRSMPSFSITRRDGGVAGQREGRRRRRARAGRRRARRDAAPSSVARPWLQRSGATVQPISTSSLPATCRGRPAARDERAASRGPASAYQPKPCVAPVAPHARDLLVDLRRRRRTPPSVAPTRGSPSSAISPSRCCGPIGSARMRAVVRPAGSITGPGRVPRGCRGRGPGCRARRRRRAPLASVRPACVTSMRGDRAVERVVLAAGRVGVDPGDGLAGRRGDARSACRRARRSPRPARRRPAPGARSPPSGVALAVELERAVGDPRRRPARDPHAADGEVEPGAGRAVEADPVQPEPASPRAARPSCGRPCPASRRARACGRRR